MLLSSAKGVRYESVVVVIDCNIICSLININLTESRFKVISKYSFFYSKAFALQDRLIRALIQTTWVLYGQAKRAISTG